MGYNENQLIPTIINNLNEEKIKRIFVGGSHSFCLNGTFNCNNHIIYELIENGNLYCWGLNDCGQLGIGNKINQNQPQKYSEDKKFIFIYGGYNHTMGLIGNSFQ